MCIRDRNTTTTLDDPDPSTTTSISVPTDPGACHAPLEGRQPLPSFDRTAMVVDLDGDDAGDPLFFVPDEERGGSWVQMDRSTDGASTTAIRLDGVFGSETFLEAADLDGDGLNEGFLELAGNTLVTGIILEMEGCELRAITTDEPAFDYGDGIFTYPISAGGNGCSPTGCVTAVYCLVDPGTGDLFVEFAQTFPVTSALDPDFDSAILDDPRARNLPIRVEEQTVTIRDGVATIVATESATLDGGSLSIDPIREFANHVDLSLIHI